MDGALTIDQAYFEEMYSKGNDPWDFEHSWYEQRKYALTMAALPDRRYGRVFEPGCAIGVLSEQLAARCDRLVAMELIPSIAEAASERLRLNPGTEVCIGSIPTSWPEGVFDLVVLSEVAYYLTPAGLEQTIVRLQEGLAPGAALVSVHYTLETNYPMSGHQVGERLRAVPWLSEAASYSEPSFELLVFRRDA